MPLPILPRNIKDPTGQDARERKAMADFERRMVAINDGTLAILNRYKPKIITINSLVLNQTFYDFNLDDLALANIGVEISALVDQMLLQQTDGQLWFMQGYVQPAYQQGTAAAWSNLSIQSGVYAMNRPTLEAVLTSAVYRTRLGYVKARVFEDMKNLSSSVKATMGRTLMDGMAQGVNPLAIAEQLSKNTKMNINRANTVARTEITTALRGARLDEAESAQIDLGVLTKMMQVSALSPTTRMSHAMRHAKLFTIQEVRIWMATSPNMINCYLPGTRVRGRFVAGSKAWYEGPVIRVVTASGNDITVTPNHPVMTYSGLVAAAKISEGDNLFAHRVNVEDPDRVANLNGELVDSAIEDVFCAIKDAGHSKTVRVSAVDFHGDGRLMDKNVNVVEVDRPLTFGCDAKLGEALDYFKLVHPYFSTPVLSAFNLGIYRVGRSSASILSGFGKLFSYLMAGGGMPNIGSIGAPSIAETGRVKPTIERDPRDANVFGYLLNGFSDLMSRMKREHVKPVGDGVTAPVDSDSLEPVVKTGDVHANLYSDFIGGLPVNVTLDKVVDVEVLFYVGHVYDLEEKSGLMVSNSLILSNCKCTFIEVLVDEKGNPETPGIIAKAKAQIPDDMAFTAD